MPLTHSSSMIHILSILSFLLWGSWVPSSPMLRVKKDKIYHFYHHISSNRARFPTLFQKSHLSPARLLLSRYDYVAGGGGELTPRTPLDDRDVWIAWCRVYEDPSPPSRQDASSHPHKRPHPRHPLFPLSLSEKGPPHLLYLTLTLVRTLLLQFPPSSSLLFEYPCLFPFSLSLSLFLSFY